MTDHTLSEDTPNTKERKAAWKEIVAQYSKPSIPRALWQIANTIIPFISLWVLMYWTLHHQSWSLKISWLLTIPLAMLAGLFVVRTFIIFHDCGHGSYFKSRLANDITGYLTGIITFTPYYHWRWEHSVHHASSGDLDKRGMGDVWTMTVQEYLESSRWKRFAYQLSRNPFILFVIAPLFLFLVWQRFTTRGANLRERFSVYFMNLSLLAWAACMASIFGILNYIIIQAIVLAVASSLGVWLFYVQHQFEGVYWERSPDWDYMDAALKGSSFYKLPKILQWFSGNIGFHHIHHLSARIPNYNLEACHNAHAIFNEVKPLTLISSLKSFTYRLWDEQQKKLITYRQLRQITRQEKAGNGR